MAGMAQLLKAQAKTLRLPGEEITTTFYGDFSVADIFGIEAIKDTFDRAFSEWKKDYRYLTNLVATLNYKAWEHSENNEAYAELYIELYEKASDYAESTLKGAEYDYYYNITD